MLQLSTVVQKKDMLTFMICQMRRRGKLIILAMAAVLVFALYTAYKAIFVGQMDMSSIASMCMSILTVILVIGSFIMGVKKVTKAQKDILGVKRNLIIDSDKVSLVDDEGAVTSSLDLAGLKDAYETKKLLLIYFESGRCLILNKSMLDSKSFKAVDDMLRAMLGADFHAKKRM